MGTSVAIGSVGGVEFIATSNPSKVSVRGDGIVDRKQEVPGNHGDVPYSKGIQARESVLDDGLGHCLFPPIDAVDQSLGWRGSQWRTAPARHMALRGRARCRLVMQEITELLHSGATPLALIF